MQSATWSVALLWLAPASAFQKALETPFLELPEGAPALPTKRGCYVWLPNGCHSKTHPLHAKTMWKKDDWGEQNARAADSEEACAARAKAFNSFCRVSDSVTVLVTGDEPAARSALIGAAPEAASTAPPPPPSRTAEEEDREILHMLGEDVPPPPSAAASRRQEDQELPPAPPTAAHLSGDSSATGPAPLTYGDEEDRHERAHARGQLIASKPIASWGEAIDSLTFEAHKKVVANGADATASMPAGAPALPTKSGCYVWLPNGCRSKTHPLHAKTMWKKDSWGELNAGAADSEDACEARKQSFDGFCRVRDAVMKLIQ